MRILLFTLAVFLWAVPAALACVVWDAEDNVSYHLGAYEVVSGVPTLAVESGRYTLGKALPEVESGTVGFYELSSPACLQSAYYASWEAPASSTARLTWWLHLHRRALLAAAFGALLLVTIAAVRLRAGHRDGYAAVAAALGAGVLAVVVNDPAWILDAPEGGLDSADSLRAALAQRMAQRDANATAHWERSRRQYPDEQPAAVPEEPEQRDPCPGSSACRKDGACSFVDDDCHATKADDCTRAESCKTRGACDLRDGACVPTTVEHCAESTGCAQHGQCALVESRCVATDDACAAWVGCPVPGGCAFRDGRCRLTEEACAAAPACAAEGRCGLKNDECLPTSEEHCRKSEICRKHKACRLTGLVSACVPENLGGKAAPSLGNINELLNQRLGTR